jgi:hypothetical protein
MGMAPSSLAPATHDHRLGLSARTSFPTRDFASWSVEPSCSSFANSKIVNYFILRAHSTAVSLHHSGMWYVQEDPGHLR